MDKEEHSKLKHSGFGIASLAIFVTTVTVHISFLVVELKAAAGINTDTFGVFLSSLLFPILTEPIFAVYLLGLALATTGLFQRDRSKTLAVLGVIFNLLGFIVIVAIIVIVVTSVTVYNPKS